MRTNLLLITIITIFLLTSCTPQTQTLQSPPPTQPSDDTMCAMDVKECPDGTFVSRQPPTCEFEDCPVDDLEQTDLENDEMLDDLEELEQELSDETTPGPENEEVDHSSKRGADTYVEDTYVLEKNGADMIKNLMCDLDKNVLSVDIHVPNNAKESYALKKYSSFAIPDGVALSRLSVNGRQIRDLETKCEGQETVAPGETAQCKFVFDVNDLSKGVMIRTGYDEFDKPLPNRIHLSSAYLQSDVTFICD